MPPPQESHDSCLAERRNSAWVTRTRGAFSIGTDASGPRTRKRPSHALTGIGRFASFVLRERTAPGSGIQKGFLVLIVATLPLRAACLRSTWALLVPCNPSQDEPPCILRNSASFRNPPGSLTSIMNPRRRIEKGRRSPRLGHGRLCWGSCWDKEVSAPTLTVGCAGCPGGGLGRPVSPFARHRGPSDRRPGDDADGRRPRPARRGRDQAPAGA